MTAMQTPLQRALNRQRAARNASKATARLLSIAQNKHCDRSLRDCLSRFAALHDGRQRPALRYLGRVEAGGVKVPVLGRVS